MNNLSATTRVYVLGTILTGAVLVGWTGLNLDWTNPWLYVLACLGAAAQTLKVEGPNERTNYSIAWFVYGFAFVSLGTTAALFVVVVAHLVEWFWHRYPWFIQGFNIGNHVLSLFLAGALFGLISRGTAAFEPLRALGLAAANLTFVLGNHFMVGLVVRLARKQSFTESGVFEFLTLFLDFTLLSMGSITAMLAQVNVLASMLNILPLYLLYHAIRVPALQRRLANMNGQA